MRVSCCVHACVMCFESIPVSYLLKCITFSNNNMMVVKVCNIEPVQTPLNV
jgi:hypothetical protein